MADIIDIANDLAQAQLDASLAAVPKPEEIAGTGCCLNCGETVVSRTTSGVLLRWCDSDCRDDWESRQQKRGPAIPAEGIGFNGLAQTANRGDYWLARTTGSQKTAFHTMGLRA